MLHWWNILHVQSNTQGSTHHGLCCTGGIFYMYNHTDRVAHTTDCAALAGIFYMYNQTQGSTHHGLCCTGWDILHVQSNTQGSTHHGLCCTGWDILHVQSHRQGSTHHGLCCTGGIFYMYNHTDRVAHTTDCAALVGYFTCTIKHTG